MASKYSVSTSESDLNAALDLTYGQVLGQTPDATTLAVDRNLLDSGVSLQSIRTYLSTSSTAVAALNATYGEVLGVALPSADVELDESLLANGQSLAGIRSYLVGSSIGALGVMYQAVLGENTDGATLTADGALLVQGQSLAGIRAYLAGTGQAFTALNVVYQAVLGQPIPAADINTDESLLAHGQSLAGIQAYLASTPEAASAIGATYQTVLGRAPTATELASAVQASASNATQMNAAGLPPAPPTSGSGSLQALTATLIEGPELANEISSATQAALGRPANGLEQLADEAEYSAGINHATLLLQLGELSGGPPPSASPSGPAPAALNGSVAEITPQTIQVSTLTDPESPSPRFVYGLLNNDALIATQPETVALSLSGGGVATIGGFNPAADTLQVQKVQDASFSNLTLTAAGMGSHDTLISLGHGGTIYLQGVAEASLHASNFSFV